MLLIASVILWILAYSLDRNAEQRRQAAEAAWVADMNAGRLSSPETFQARCGNAVGVRKDGKGSYLKYPGDLIVWIPSSGTPRLGTMTLAGVDSSDPRGFPVSADYAWSDLRCH